MKKDLYPSFRFFSIMHPWHNKLDNNEIQVNSNSNETKYLEKKFTLGEVPQTIFRQVCAILALNKAFGNPGAFLHEGTHKSESPKQAEHYGKNLNIEV